MSSLLFWGAAVVVLGSSRLALPSVVHASSSHSMRYFYTSVSEPGQGLPQFIAVGYVDDQLFVQYDSNSKTALPQVPWMEKVSEDDAHYWEQNNQIFRNSEQVFRVSLGNVQKYYNQSGGFHTVQQMYGCELRRDGSKGGFMQYGYDGRDYLSLDKETLSWTAADAKAQITKWKSEAEPAIAQRYKAYLENTCIDWLQRYMGYREEALQKTEPPVVKVSRCKSSTEDLETLICQAHGFYPKEIEATWTRDGENWEQETFRRRVAPNPDGTYYVWLCIDIDPKDRDHYQCRVDHAGLSEPLVLGWEKGQITEANVGLMLGAIIGAFLLLLLATSMLIFFIKKEQVCKLLKVKLPKHQEANCSSKPCSELSEGSDRTLLEKA